MIYELSLDITKLYAMPCLKFWNIGPSMPGFREINTLEKMRAESEKYMICSKNSQKDKKMSSRENEIRKKIIKDIRPWGDFKRYAHNENCTVKIITVNPNQMLSKQVHKKRDELWIILDDGLRVELGDKIFDPKPGNEIIILRNTKHRLSSLGKKGKVLEVSFGYSDENDIERVDDIYGRK